MITADTITDEQIRELHSEMRSAEDGFMYVTWEALGHEQGPCYRKPTADEVRDARARCAAILNAREAKP